MRTPFQLRRPPVRLAAVLLTTGGLVGLTLATVSAAEAQHASFAASSFDATPESSVRPSSLDDFSTPPAEYADGIRTAVNQARQSEGLAALTRDACAAGSADRWSGFLAVNDRFLHQELDSVMDGCQAGYASEALARGSISPRTVVDLWLQSPEHRQILLDPRPDRIGVGAHLDAEGRWVVTVVLLGP